MAYNNYTIGLHKTNHFFAKYLKPSLTQQLDDYPEAAFALLFSLEDRHFWFQSRNRAIHQTIVRYFPNVKGKTFLEVGCGTGYVLSMLDRMWFRVTGLDMHEEALRFARKRTKATLVCSTLDKHKVHVPYDAIGAFDVMEHVENDREFLTQCSSLLSPGGYIFLTVPAGMELWTDIDRVSGHKRRYTRNNLLSLLTEAGFTVTDIRYFGFFQYVPYLFTKKIVSRRIHPKNTSEIALIKAILTPPPLIIHAIFMFLFRLEDLLSRVIPLPFGTSLIVSAYKNTRSHQVALKNQDDKSKRK